MRIVIVGAGKVGFKLAQVLSELKHEVLVIEEDPERHKTIEEQLEVQAFCANGTSPGVLKEVGIGETDLLVAVTDDDETNIVASLMAKKLGAKRVVARVANPDYLTDEELDLQKALDIDFIINPEQVTAAAVAKLIQFPEAAEVEYCAGGKIQVLELTIPAGAPVVNKKLYELPSTFSYLIVAIVRENRFIIPTGQDSLLVGDRVFVLAPAYGMEHVEELLGQHRSRIQSVVVVGGTRTAYYLAQELMGKHIELRIIDKDLARCEALSKEFPSATIVHGDGTDINLLEEEDIGRADFFAALTSDDKVNLLVSILAKNLGAKKVLAQVRRSDYADLMQRVGIDAVISPRLLTAAQILRFVHCDEIASLSFVGQDKAEMIEFFVSPQCQIIGKPLKEAGLPRRAIVGAIVRGEEVIIPRGSDYVLPGDRAVVIALPEVVAAVERVFGLERRRDHGLRRPGIHLGKGLYYS